MESKFINTFKAAKSWASECHHLGWLHERDVNRFNKIDSRSPNTLFRNEGHRPLVVAFFGGTGVGKSTLLNRLAEHEIARTGVIRPTSREISLYLHQSFELDQIPSNFPIEKVRLDRHCNDDLRNILWIDMPDIDSIEKSNREIVLEWLPHIDVLLYVVSPERYHDENGWRLLLSEGSRHAWLFIMNQFDKGDSSQLEALSKQLQSAGFDDPIVFATDCSDRKPENPDDFQKLKETIQELAKKHTIEQLERKNITARMYEVEKTVGDCVNALGSTEAINQVIQKWETVWKNASDDLDAGLQWPIQVAAGEMGATSGTHRLMNKLSEESNPKSESKSQSTPAVLWDDWAQTRFEDALDQIEVYAGSGEISTIPFNKHLIKIRPQAKKILHAEAEQSLRRALANPGNSIQRFFLALTRICSIFLPLAAMAWVAFEILDQFHDSSVTTEPYLGVNFAIHSVLMISISWLLPWFIYKKLKPSTEKVALNALQNGIRIGFEIIKSRIDESLQILIDQRNHLVQAAEIIQQDCQVEPATTSPVENTTLSRMLPDNIAKSNNSQIKYNSNHRR